MGVTATVTVIETASFESGQICDILCVWSVQLVCYVVFGVVCLVESFFFFK